MSAEAPPAWGQQLLSLLQGVQQQQAQMQAQQTQLMQQHTQLLQQFESLRLSDRAATPPPLPPTVSTDALASLVAHPLLSDEDNHYARLLQAAFPVIIAEQDTDLVAQC